MMAVARCEVSECTNPSISRGLCSKHYTRWLKYGDPLGGGEFRVKQSSVCSVVDCGRKSKARSLCDRHYQRFLHHGDPLFTPEKPPCSVPECPNPHAAKGYCHHHYGNFSRYGDPLAGRRAPGAKRGEPLRWLQDHVGHTGGACLIWPFSRPGKGYGQVCAGETVGAHRKMCALAHGEPPTPKHFAAHNCGNGYGGCVNPRHLRWATPQENTLDRYDHGTMVFGEASPFAKLTADQAREILALKGQAKQRDIARQYGVCKSLVGAIHRREIWTSL